MKNNSHSITYKYLIAACLASLIISTFASYFFYNKWSESEDRIVTLVNESNALAAKYSLEKNTFEKTFNDLMIVRDENATIVTLTATDSSKRYIARVYWNHYTRETFIDPLSLPMPDSSNDYQLWAVVAGQPVDAGVFSSDVEKGIQRSKSVSNADTWAVTLEPKGGSPAPNVEKMFLKSKN